jgi:hypothetical protein
LQLLDIALAYTFQLSTFRQYDGGSYSMIATISSGVTVPSAVLAGVGGIVLVFLAPVLAARVGQQNGNGNRQARVALVFGIQVVAVILLFAAGKAFGIIPGMTTLAKVGIVVGAALVLTGLSVALLSARGKT